MERATLPISPEAPPTPPNHPTPPSPRTQCLYGSLHLTPSTFDNWLAIAVETHGSYELIDGVLAYRPMANSEHRTLQQTIPSLIETYNDLSGVTGNERISARIEAKLRVSMDTTYLVDFIILRESDNHIEELSAEHVLVACEIASKNCSNDKTVKRLAYSKMGIPRYVLIDQRRKTVSVLSHQDDSSSIGKAARRNPRRKASARNEDYRYVREFKGNDIIECKYFKQIRIPAAQLLDATNIKEVAKNAISKPHRERAEQANSRAQMEQKRREEADARAEQADARAEQADARAQMERKTREQADARAEQADARANREKDKRKRSEDKMKSLKARLAQYEDVSSDSTSSA